MFKQKEPTTVQILSNESNKLKYFLLWNSGWEKWEKRRKKSTVRKVFFIEGVLKREEEVKGGSIVRSQGVGFTELYRQVRITETGKITEAGKDYSDRERLQRHERITQIGKEFREREGLHERRKASHNNFQSEPLSLHFFVPATSKSSFFEFNFFLMQYPLR